MFNPFSRVGAMRRREVINWLLTLASISTSPPLSFVPSIFIGGQPSVPRYVILAPNVLRASTNGFIGRCLMRFEPERILVPSRAAKNAVKKRMVVPPDPVL